MIPPEKEYQWTLQNFLGNPQYTSVVFNALLNYNKLIENELKDPFSLKDYERRKDFTDWDKFAYKEYDLLKKNYDGDGEDDEEEDEQVFDDD